MPMRSDRDRVLAGGAAGAFAVSIVSHWLLTLGRFRKAAADDSWTVVASEVEGAA